MDYLEVPKIGQDNNSTENVWNLEKARKLSQELLKEFPEGNMVGSMIRLVKRL